MLNRRVVRLAMFDKDAGYVAFEKVLAQAGPNPGQLGRLGQWSADGARVEDITAKRRSRLSLRRPRLAGARIGSIEIGVEPA